MDNHPDVFGDQITDIRGERIETDEEFELRKTAIAKTKEQIAKIKSNKEAKELKEYERLHKKFGSDEHGENTD